MPHFWTVKQNFQQTYILTTHDMRSSISLFRSGSLSLFISLLRACYTHKMSWEKSHKISYRQHSAVKICNYTCLSAGRSFSYKKLYLFLNLQVQAHVIFVSATQFTLRKHEKLPDLIKPSCSK